jgi:hypothetical protein
MATEPDTRLADAGSRGTSRKFTIINWTLGLLTILGAAAAVLVAYGLTLGTAACTDRSARIWAWGTMYSVQSSTALPWSPW